MLQQQQAEQLSVMFMEMQQEAADILYKMAEMYAENFPLLVERQGRQYN